MEITDDIRPPLGYPTPGSIADIQNYIQGEEGLDDNGNPKPTGLVEFVSAQSNKDRKLILFFRSLDDFKKLNPVHLERIDPDATADEEAATVNKRIDAGAAPFTQFFDADLTDGPISFMAYRSSTPLPPLPEAGPDGWITTTATIFGLNWDGSPDKEDNGIGAPALGSIPTANKEIVGCAIPMRLVLKKFGTYAGARGKSIEVVNLKSDKTVIAKIVDLGPGEGPIARGHALDLTWAAQNAIDGGGDCKVKYRFLS